MTLPDFLVIGAQRAGSTLLHRVLAGHGEVYVPTRRKEIHFFDRYFDRGTGWYQEFFPPPEQAAGFRAIGEVTPDYLAMPGVPERVRSLLPDCRLVVILRNPVERAYSWYLYRRRSANERRAFATFLEQDPTALPWGLYHAHIQRFLGVFPREALFILIFEEALKAPQRELGHLASFLGLERAWAELPSLLKEKLNTSEAPRLPGAFAFARNVGHLLMRHDLDGPVRLAKRLGVRGFFGRGGPPPPLDPGSRKHLVDFYREDARALQILMRRDLPIWQL